jgi:hypothetical protein
MNLHARDPVYALTDFSRYGAAVEYITVRADRLALKPLSINHVYSAALPLWGPTAWQILFSHAHLEKNQKVLIHGKAGGLGTLTAPLRGAHVITTGPAVRYISFAALRVNIRVVGTRIRIFLCISAPLVALLLWLALRPLFIALASIIIGVFLCGVTDFVTRRTNLIGRLAYTLVVSSTVVATGGAVWFMKSHVAATQGSSFKIFQDPSDI